MHNLRMELNSVKLLLIILHTCDRAVIGMSSRMEALRKLSYIVRVAHPCIYLRFDPFEEK